VVLYGIPQEYTRSLGPAIRISSSGKETNGSTDPDNFALWLNNDELPISFGLATAAASSLGTFSFDMVLPVRY